MGKPTVNRDIVLALHNYTCKWFSAGSLEHVSIGICLDKITRKDIKSKYSSPVRDMLRDGTATLDDIDNYVNVNMMRVVAIAADFVDRLMDEYAPKKERVFQLLESLDVSGDPAIRNIERFRFIMNHAASIANKHPDFGYKFYELIGMDDGRI